jgi:hypothetical protein
MAKPATPSKASFDSLAEKRSINFNTTAEIDSFENVINNPVSGENIFFQVDPFLTDLNYYDQVLSLQVGLVTWWNVNRPNANRLNANRLNANFLNANRPNANWPNVNWLG